MRSVVDLTLEWCTVLGMVRISRWTSPSAHSFPVKKTNKVISVFEIAGHLESTGNARRNGRSIHRYWPSPKARGTLA